MSLGKYLDISTSHVTKQDMDLLLEAGLAGRSSVLPVIAEYREGVIAYADPDADFDAFRATGASESFIKVLHYAIRHDCYLVRLDCNGEIIEDNALDRHSW